MDRVATNLGQWWRTQCQHQAFPQWKSSHNYLWCHPVLQRLWLPLQPQLYLESLTLLVWLPWEKHGVFLVGNPHLTHHLYLQWQRCKSSSLTVFLIQFSVLPRRNWVMHPVKKGGRVGSEGLDSSKIAITAALATLNHEHHLWSC